MKDKNSLSHTVYQCKYHIIMIPKYRRMVIYNKLKRDIGQILRTLIERKPGIKIIEAEACPDHIHMLVEIPPKYSVSIQIWKPQILGERILCGYCWKK